VRAMQEASPAWRTVDPYQGWANRAKEIVVHDIPASHLGVLREPHVQSLASAIAHIATLGNG